MEPSVQGQICEIDLRGCLSSLAKHKRAIFFICALSVMAAALISLRMSRWCEVESTIQLGSVEEPLFNNAEAEAILLNPVLLARLDERLKTGLATDSFTKLVKIKTLPGTHLLSVKVSYPGVDQAFLIHREITSALLEQGRSIYDSRIAVALERLGELESEIKEAQVGINRMRQLVIDLSVPSGITQADLYWRAAFLQSSLFSYERMLSDLRNEKNKIKLSLVDAKEFKLYSQPRVLDNLAYRNFFRNVLFAGFISLLMSVFIVCLFKNR